MLFDLFNVELKDAERRVKEDIIAYEKILNNPLCNELDKKTANKMLANCREVLKIIQRAKKSMEETEIEENR